VFAFEFGDVKPAPPAQPMIRCIKRSAGCKRNQAGEIEWVEAIPDCAYVVLPKSAVCELPAWMAESTRLHRLHEAEWRDEWLRRRADRGLESIKPKDAAGDATAINEPPMQATSTKRRVAQAVAMAIDAGATWLDQYKSPLGKRKHLRLCREGLLPHRKDGKQRLVRRADIDAYLDRNGTPSKAGDVDIDRELEALGMARRAKP
jgi:hypothetical protein